MGDLICTNHMLTCCQYQRSCVPVYWYWQWAECVFVLCTLLYVTITHYTYTYRRLTLIYLECLTSDFQGYRVPSTAISNNIFYYLYWYVLCCYFRNSFSEFTMVRYQYTYPRTGAEEDIRASENYFGPDRYLLYLIYSSEMGRSAVL